MHYKDGTPAILGDIVQADDGSVGILIGGQIGQDYCSSHVVQFKPALNKYGAATGSGFVGRLLDANGAVLARASVVVEFGTSVQTRECLKIGHVDIGHG